VADYAGWMQYFMRHLGGFSRQARMFVEGYIGALSVPEKTPEQFDPTFERLPIYIPPKAEAVAEREWRKRADSRPIDRALFDSSSMFAGNQRYNVFVPSFAPQFEAMRARGGIPGNTIEGETVDGEFRRFDRKGVWVPYEWLDKTAGPAARWQPFTAEQLRAIYGREQPRPEP
jgi:hypothetical protein